MYRSRLRSGDNKTTTTLHHQQQVGNSDDSYSRTSTTNPIGIGEMDDTDSKDLYHQLLSSPPSQHPPPPRYFYRQPTSILRERFFSKTSLALACIFLLIVLCSKWISNFIILKTEPIGPSELLSKQLLFVHERQQEHQRRRTHQSPLLVHFIHTTDESSFKLHNLLAIESVLYHHPNTHAIVHVPPKKKQQQEEETSNGQQENQEGQERHQDTDNDNEELMMSDQPLRPLINAGYNVKIQTLDIKTLLQQVLSTAASAGAKEVGHDASPTTIIKTTKIQQFINRIEQYEYYAPNWYVDVSDLARLLLLYVHGGIYLDTDVIVVKPLVALEANDKNEKGHTPLPNNVLAWEQQQDDYDRSMSLITKDNDSHQLANGAILKFLNPYNEFIGDCINEYLDTYSITNEWGYNGPQLLTRVFMGKTKTKAKNNNGRDYSQTCTLDKLFNGDNNYQQQPHVDNCPVIMLPKSTFYPLSWWRINEVCFQNPLQVRSNASMMLYVRGSVISCSLSVLACVGFSPFIL